MKIKNLANNQIVVIEDNGKETFFSYGTIIATKENEIITLDEKYWNFSKTTSKYLNQFLGCPAEELDCIFSNLNN